MNNAHKIRLSVSESYSNAVDRTNSDITACCSSSPSQGFATLLAGYSRETLASLPADAVANSFGCGNPIALAEIKEGDTILDLGSGAGIDILLAAKLTGPSGKVFGVDMTKAMIERARENARLAGLSNVEVREGIIEDLPIESGAIDLVISNCVINLSPEKSRVYSEIFRVLKHGGRFSISDMVVEKMPDWARELTVLYSACISGAISESEYLAGLQEAGLQDVIIRDRLVYSQEQLLTLIGTEEGCSCGCGSGGFAKSVMQQIAQELAGTVASIRVVGRKP